MTTYGYTVKDVRREQSDYASFFDRATTYGCKVLSKVAEYDSKGRLHYHGTMVLPSGFKYSKLRSYGLHTHFKKIYDMPGWIAYLKKQDIHLDPNDEYDTNDNALMSSLKTRLF